MVGLNLSLPVHRLLLRSSHPAALSLLFPIIQISTAAQIRRGQRRAPRCGRGHRATRRCLSWHHPSSRCSTSRGRHPDRGGWRWPTAISVRWSTVRLCCSQHAGVMNLKGLSYLLLAIEVYAHHVFGNEYLMTVSLFIGCLMTEMPNKTLNRTSIIDDVF
jgi:hypothetical protein